MSEFKGTKGKWEIYNPSHIGCKNVSIGDNGYVELWYHHFDGKEEAIANAKLIACAPEMLEMLKIMGDALLELMNHQDGWEDDYENLKQLIKKAAEL